MGTLITIAQVILCLSILVTLHECGHFFPAKWFKTKVDKFYLFFDPYFSLFSYKPKGSDTEYGIGWLPLGGYVKIAGMIDESMDKEQMEGPVQPWEFRAKPAWQRLIIMLGGVTVNFVLGFFILAMLAWSYGSQYIAADKVTEGIHVSETGAAMGLQDGDMIKKIGAKDFVKFDPSHLVTGIVLDGAKSMEVERNGEAITLPIDSKYVGLLSKQKRPEIFGARLASVVGVLGEGSIAEKEGIKIGDQLLSLGGESIFYHHDYKRVVKNHYDKQTELVLLRNGRDSLIMSVKIPTGEPLGFIPQQPESTVQNYGFLESFPKGYQDGKDFLYSQYKAFSQMGTGEDKIDPRESLGSIISIGKMFGTEWDWYRFWKMTAVLSLILAIMNLLPIPALDGGHVVFLLFEWITGIKPSEKVMEYSTLVGFVLLIILMVFVLGLDIWRLFR